MPWRASADRGSGFKGLGLRGLCLRGLGPLGVVAGGVGRRLPGEAAAAGWGEVGPTLARNRPITKGQLAWAAVLRSRWWGRRTVARAAVPVRFAISVFAILVSVISVISVALVISVAPVPVSCR